MNTKKKGRPRKELGGPVIIRGKPKNIDPYHLPKQTGSSVIQELLNMFPSELNKAKREEK